MTVYSRPADAAKHLAGVKSIIDHLPVAGRDALAPVEGAYLRLVAAIHYTAICSESEAIPPR